jgi:hypothetical protein
MQETAAPARPKVEKERFPVSPLQRHWKRMLMLMQLLQLLQLLQLMLLHQERRGEWWALGHALDTLGNLF